MIRYVQEIKAPTGKTTEHFRHLVYEMVALQNRWDLWKENPFWHNETASVSAVVAAATRAGYLALADYASKKRSRADRRSKNDGRVDLYIGSESLDWVLEFKQSWGSKWDKLSEKLVSATDDAVRAKHDATCAFGAVIVDLNYEHETDEAGREQYGELVASLKKSMSYAWAFGRPDVPPDTYFILTAVDSPEHDRLKRL